ncbi:MAG TPA: nucleotidyltransferase domain-containing protein [Chloroflexota bacterium]|nr:nucleotidyltransferase domain-containing protein [Chloroflexota bacterium]
MAQRENRGQVITADVIALMTERIVDRFHPLKVVLFGSHARGDAGPRSDIDLLVVLPDPVADKRRATVEILRTLRDRTVPIDVVVTTPDEIARRGDLVGTVLRPALREGKVLYERS